MSQRRVVQLRAASAIVGAIVIGLVLRSVLLPEPGPPPGAALGSAIEDTLGTPPTRDLAPYTGHGAWVDAFDFVPAYSNGAPALEAATAVDDMVDAGVGTLYLQAAREDDRSAGHIVDPETVGIWLVAAHQRDIKVVAWYLPTFVDIERDLAHLEAMRRFDVLGHQFDGVAVDIESTVVEDAVVRSARLVELSDRFRVVSGGETLGAIVLPTVLLEVVNTDFWPSFPWREVARSYDIWLPMAYWSNRTEDSGYRDGFTYLAESTRRMRANLGDADALVHGIGGIGDDLTDDDLRLFADALTEIDATGGSIYDWQTLPPAQRTLFTSD